MKLFDYKFLILLALTLVVYFIYREILDLKNKVKELETKTNNRNPEIENVNTNIVNNLDLMPINQIDGKNEHIVDFQIPLPPPPTDNFEEIINQRSIIEEESENFATVDNSVDHLAIYSNDNEKTNSYSLGESSDLGISDNFDIEEEDMETKSIETNDEKKKIVLVKSEGDEDLIDSSENENLNNKSINNLSVSELLKFKLNELQCFAEEVKVDINNTVKNKKKTKNELANDLFNYYQNLKNSLKF